MQREALKSQRRALKYQARLQRAQFRMQRRAMRRRSIVGPLVLVLLGVLVLLAQAGRISWSHMMDWYGRWWPMVMIAAGLVLLLEWAIDHARVDANGNPVGTRALGGGVVFLFLVMAAAGVCLRYSDIGEMWREHWIGLGWSGLAEAVGDAHEADSETQHSIAANGTLILRNPHGDVSVTGTSSDGQIHVTTHKQVWTLQESDATRREQDLEPEFSGSDSHLTLNLGSVRGGQSDVTVTVPDSTSVTVEALHGDATITGLNAPAEVTANRGNVEVGSIRGNIRVHMNHDSASLSAHEVTGGVTLEGRAGDITLSDVGGPVALQGDFFGTTHAERIRGAFRFHTSRTHFEAQRVDGTFEVSGGSNADLEAHQVLGPVVLKTRNRNITLERVQGSVEVTNRNGEVNITQAKPLASIQVDNVHGSVNVGLAEGQGFTLNATTRHGDLENDFNLTETTAGDQKSLSGSVAGGGPSIRLTTTEGDVTVRKSTVDPLPPLPPPPPLAPAGPNPMPSAAPVAAPAPKAAPARPASPAKPAAPASPKRPKSPSAVDF